MFTYIDTAVIFGSERKRDKVMQVNQVAHKIVLFHPFNLIVW
jgi:hypothetical protein